MSDPGPRLFPRLKLIDDLTPRAAALNMALDEVLLEGIGVNPLLRIYRWERPSVSFGCFEPIGPVEEKWPTHDLVRRWTGGGVVEHGQDLTFSLIVPRESVLASLPTTDSYRLIHAAVASALAGVGCPMATMEGVAADADVGGSRACFEHPVRHDLLLAGSKVAGGAQRRTQRGMLHQGSIQHASAGSESALGARALQALAFALPGAFGVCVETHPLREVEIENATALASSKYGCAAWLRRW